MAIRCPLVLQPSLAVVYRLSTAETHQNVPDAIPNDAGYDDFFKEPVVYENAEGVRTTTRVEQGPIYIPCQVETVSDQKINMLYSGNSPTTVFTFVFHRMDLERLDLLTAQGDCALKIGDRIASINRYGAMVGVVVRSLPPPGLFIDEVQAGSWGFGPDGYDLAIVTASDRTQGV